MYNGTLSEENVNRNCYRENQEWKEDNVLSNDSSYLNRHISSVKVFIF